MIIFTPTYRDLATFFMHAQQMEKAGVPLRQMLQAAAQDSGHRALAEAALWMEQELAAGKTLSEAMASQPRLFNATIVTLVGAGETTGRLGFAFGKCFDYCVQMENFKRNMRRETRNFKFSALVILVLLLVLGKNALPVMTVMLILFLAALVAGYCFVPSFRQFCEYIFIVTPYLGRFIRKLEMARFAETLGLYYETGIPMRKALPAAVKAVQNHSMRGVLAVAARRVLEGERFADAFRSIPQVENTFLVMLAAGEKSGNFAKTMQEIAGYYRADMEDALDALQKAAAPLLTVVLGLIVYINFV